MHVPHAATLLFQIPKHYKRNKTPISFGLMITEKGKLLGEMKILNHSTILSTLSLDTKLLSILFYSEVGARF